MGHQKKSSITVLALMTILTVLTLCAIMLIVSLTQSGHADTLSFVRTIEGEIPGVSVRVEPSYFHRDDIILSRPDLGSPSGMKEVVRIRPIAGGRFNVTLYDFNQGGFGNPKQMTMQNLASTARQIL